MAYKNKEDQLKNQRKHYHTVGKEKQKLRVKERRDKIKKWFQEYKKTLKCSRCSEDHPSCLDFHHQDSNIKDKEISKMVHDGHSIENVQKELDKCIPLYSNCHRKEHWKNKKK